MSTNGPLPGGYIRREETAMAEYADRITGKKAV